MKTNVHPYLQTNMRKRERRSYERVILAPTDKRQITDKNYVTQGW